MLEKNKINKEELKYTKFSSFVFNNKLMYRTTMLFFISCIGNILIGLPLKAIPLTFVYNFFLGHVCFYCLGYFTHCIITKDISGLISYWHYSGISVEEKTKLFSKLQFYPYLKIIETWIIFFICISLSTAFISFYYHVDINLCHRYFIIATLMFYIYQISHLYDIQEVCSDLASALLSEGINASKYKQRTQLSSIVSFTTFVINPIVITIALSLIIANLKFTPVIIYPNGTICCHTLPGTECFENIYIKGTFDTQKYATNMIIISIINISTIFQILRLYFGELAKYIYKMRDSLELIKKYNFSSPVYFPVDLFKELSYTMHILDESILMFTNYIQNNIVINNEISFSEDELILIQADSSTKIKSLSNNMTEIEKDMKNLNEFSETIKSKTDELIILSSNMETKIDSYNTSLKTNSEVMHDITLSNLSTIAEIENLTIKLRSIVEILTLIDSVSEQTRIIAFNAELENAKNGFENEHFNTITKDIRDLTILISDLTNEIKEQLSILRESSRSLIYQANECTSQIEKGNQISLTLQKEFKKITRNVRITNTLSNKVNEYIITQNESFKDFTKNINEINETVKGFEDIAENLTITIQDLNKNQNNIEFLKKQYSTENSEIEEIEQYLLQKARQNGGKQ